MKHHAMWMTLVAPIIADPPSWKDSFPPSSIVSRCPPVPQACAPVAAWLSEHTPSLKQPDQTATARERELARFGVTDYIAARRAGNVTCEEYTATLVKRIQYYRYMNQFMYWDAFPNQTDYMMTQARAIDQKAASEGVEAIAPLYGLPFPIKGTVATTDFPSSAGSGVLHQYHAVEDAAIIKLLRQANAVIMGKTNVPEFACSLITANYVGWPLGSERFTALSFLCTPYFLQARTGERACSEPVQPLSRHVRIEWWCRLRRGLAPCTDCSVGGHGWLHPLPRSPPKQFRLRPSAQSLPE